jgi:hypothetical protein
MVRRRWHRSWLSKFLRAMCRLIRSSGPAEPPNWRCNVARPKSLLRASRFPRPLQWCRSAGPRLPPTRSPRRRAAQWADGSEAFRVRVGNACVNSREVCLPDSMRLIRAGTAHPHRRLINHCALLDVRLPSRGASTGPRPAGPVRPCIMINDLHHRYDARSWARRRLEGVRRWHASPGRQYRNRVATRMRS